jgi:xylulokinase
VYACSNDTWAAVAGLGALRAGYAYNISGTAEVFGVIGTQAASAPGLMTVDWGAGLYQIGGPGKNGADTVAWLLSLLAAQAGGKTDVSAAMAALLAGPRDPQPVLFLPYLQGERVPYWDAALRGAFVGLNRRHGATDLAWAVLEGLAFLNRIVLERGEEAAGRKVPEIRFGGGAAANPAWCQVKADVCDRPVVVGEHAEPGIVGAAAVAWTGVGRYGTLDEAQQTMARPGRRYEPDAQRSVAYSDLYRLYRRAEDALAPISRELAAHGA